MLLSLTLVLERKQNGIEEVRIDANHRPTAIEVTGMRLPCDEATVEIDRRAASDFEGGHHAQKPGKQSAPVGRRGESGLNLSQGRFVNARRQHRPRGG